jgi:hypothetical protein
VAEAGRLREQGVVLLAACTSSDCDQACLNEATGSEARVYDDSPSSGGQISSHLASGRFAPASAVGPLPFPGVPSASLWLSEGVEFLFGTPEPRRIGEDGLLFRPNLAAGTEAGERAFEFEYWVRPHREGRVPLSVAPVLEYTDRKGVLWSVDLPVTFVEVGPAPTPSATPTPYATPTAADPDRSDRPSSAVLFLPFGLNQVALHEAHDPLR